MANSWGQHALRDVPLARVVHLPVRARRRRAGRVSIAAVSGAAGLPAGRALDVRITEALPQQLSPLAETHGLFNVALPAADREAVRFPATLVHGQQAKARLEVLVKQVQPRPRDDLADSYDLVIGQLHRGAHQLSPSTVICPYSIASCNSV